MLPALHTEAELLVATSAMRNLARLARYGLLGSLAALFALAAPGWANAQARKMELADLQKIVNVFSPEISPDGKSIVIVVSP